MEEGRQGLPAAPSHCPLSWLGALPWFRAQAKLRSHWRWWRQARPRSEIWGQPANESSCNESASW